MDDINSQIISIISIVFTSINSFILITICKMHIKQKYIRKGYFQIVFTQIIIELLLNLTMLAISILNMIYDILSLNGIYLIFIPILFNFFFMTDILYNIQTIFFLKNAKNKIDKEDNFNDNDSRGSFDRSSSINVEHYTFKRIHIISFFFSFIHSIKYLFIIFNNNYNNNNNKDGKNNNDNINIFNWNNFFVYFIIDPNISNNNNESLLYLLLYIFNYIFLFSSIIYCCINQKIDGTIKLKYYSIYCLLSSLISLIFPISFILNILPINKKSNLFIDIYFSLFIIYLICNCIFRLKCYYVQYILSSQGISLCSKLSFGLKIFFTRTIIPPPNFIDFNNTFLFHSLATENDFFNQNDLNKDDLSRALSLIEE